MKSILRIIPLLFIISACNTEPVTNNQARFIDTGISSDGWTTIPAGKYYHGMHSHDSIINYDYEMMTTPVTNEQYCDFLNAALKDKYIKIENDTVNGYYPGEPFDEYNHEMAIKEGDKIYYPLNAPGGHIKIKNGEFYVDKGFENHPVVMVSWFGARGYAEYHNYRLPTEAEWEKAARGTDKRPYPWGSKINSGITNYNLREYKLEDILEIRVARTTPVAFYNGNSYLGMQTSDNKNTYGLYDMAGNVWEWTSDDYPDTHYRYMRGGSFSNYEYNLTVWARNSAEPDFCSYNTGFRCIRYK